LQAKLNKLQAKS